MPNFILMVLGVLLIGATRFSILPDTLSKIIYPLFHATAGLTIFFLLLLAVKSGQVQGSFTNVTIGGTLIGEGGIALGFLEHS